MAQDISNLIRPGTVQRSKLFDGMARAANEALAAGVTLSFPRLILSPGKWIEKWKGVEKVVTLPGHPNVPSPWVDIVMIDVQKDMSRLFYPPAPGGGSSYVPGMRHSKPACKSSNGIRPDDDVPNPVNPVCATCPNDAWKSGGTPASPNAKACQQRRRTIVVPYGDDLTNEAAGGPMLLSVPPGSLSNQAEYKNVLADIDEPYFGLVTRLSYETEDPKTGQSVKFPRIKFDYLRQSSGDPWWLNDQEAQVVKELRDSEKVKHILNSKIPMDDSEGEGEESEAGAGGVKLAPKPAIPPTPRVDPAPAPPREPGGRPVSGITEAVQNPAPPPPSARIVNTAKPQLKAVPPSPVDDGEEEAHAPLPGGESSLFDKYMDME